MAVAMGNTILEASEAPAGLSDWGRDIGGYLSRKERKGKGCAGPHDAGAFWR